MRGTWGACSVSFDFKRRKMLAAVRAPTTRTTNRKSIFLGGWLHIRRWLIGEVISIRCPQVASAFAVGWILWTKSGGINPKVLVGYSRFHYWWRPFATAKRNVGSLHFAVR